MARRNVNSVTYRIDEQDREHTGLAKDIRQGTRDLATGLGLQASSVLHKTTHQRVAKEIEDLAIMDAKLEMKVTATARAMEALVAEMDRKRQSARGGGGAVADAEDELKADYFTEKIKAAVALAMTGADAKAVKSKTYKDIMKKIQAASEDEEEDIVMTSSDRPSATCPLTSTTFVDPVRSKKCKHTYEKAAMAHHIRISKKKPAACPVAGCSHTVTTADLEADKEMLRRVRIECQTEPAESAIEAEDVEDESLGETYL